ncbi:MAG TPA: vWA domain-containing protein [Thermoanaerobaculia bacterium]|nr:vWA domain-containing protein [Thermoanaerobaculia bacterium]
MKRLPLAVVVLVFAGFARAQTLGPVDWIFLVDTSKSMRGVGKGSKNVFPEVKASIDSFINEASDGDSVAIFTFDRSASLRSAMPVNADARADLHQIVAGLEAEGNRTHLGDAIAKGLDRAATLRRTLDPTRTRAVVLFTDGREDIRDIEDPVRIDANVQRAADTFIYFVSMGDHEPQLDAFAAATKRTTVLKAPTAEAIRDVARKIRATIPPPKPKPQPLVQTTPPPAPEPPPSTLTQALRTIFALTLLGAIAAAIVYQQRKKNRLEGELEILRPRTAPDNAYVGLPKLQATEVALSAILPPDALAGSDARLFVKRRAGKKKVWIATRGGSLRINDVETPMTELYDADTIEIGDAKLRFNRVGDERPHQEADL